MENLLFMSELQRSRELCGWGVNTTGELPGFARTEAIMRPDDGILKRTLTQVMSGLVPTAESAARPIVHAATSPEVVPSGYYGPSGPGEIAGRVGPAKLAARAKDPALAARLWEVSEELTAVTFAGN